MSRRQRLTARPRLEFLEIRCVLSGVTPAQLDSAYGLNAITFSNGTIKGTGEGQTIAIVDAFNDPTIYSDLTAFDAKYGLTNPLMTSTPVSNPAKSTNLPSFSVISQGTTSNSNWFMEEALDVELAHAAAPGANILLVEAASSNLGDLLAGVSAAQQIPSVSVVSMSWGGAEFPGQTNYDSTFTTPVGHGGITYLASSGDSGAGAQYPASSPNVIGVGGTSLSIGSTGARTSESAWSGSGGAISQVESKPGYQASVLSGNFRGAPDVSLDADPGSGIVIVTQGGQVQVGGTSLSSPVWGGLIAIADQGLTIAGKATLDGATQTLPDLYKAPTGSFYDVTTGSRATTGYDTSTGLGTPNAPKLVAYLSGSTNGSGTTGTGTTGSGTGTGTGTGTTGTGTTGGGGGTTTTPPTPPTSTPPPKHRPRHGWWGGYYTSPYSGGATTRETVGRIFKGGTNLFETVAPKSVASADATDAVLKAWKKARE